MAVKHVCEYRQGKLFFWFSNSITKTCSYGLKILMIIEIKYVFHFKAYFHVLDFIQVPKCLQG